MNCRAVAIWLFGRLALLSVTLLLMFFSLEMLIRHFVPVRAVGPTLSVYDPVYGARLKKSHSSVKRTPEFTTQVTTNSYGFRGPEPNSVPVRPILFLGDSFTLGYGVNDGEEFPAIIREALRTEYGEQAAPVVNAGVGNVGNGHWIKFLEIEAPSYNPRLIVFQPLDNDFGNNVRERLYAIDPSGQLEEQRIPPPSGLRRIQSFIDLVPGLNHSYVVGAIKQALVRQQWRVRRETRGAAADQSAKAEKDLTMRIIGRALEICEDNGWPAMMINIDIKGAKLEALRGLLSPGTPLIQLPDKQERPDHFFEVDGHWNAAGHRHAADLLYQFIKATYLENPGATTKGE